MKHYEAIVVGCGGLGSAALYWLSRELGSLVLGIEQFKLGHVRGASQDHSRIIRLAQHQPEYAALAPDAYKAYYHIEEESGVKILNKTGGLVIEAVEERDPEKVGTRNVEGYVAAFEEFGFDYELLGPDELMYRWPQFHLEGTEKAIYQEDSGIVDAGKTNAVPHRPGPGPGREGPGGKAGTSGTAEWCWRRGSYGMRRPTTPTGS